jgi:hypothetical protein
VHGSQVKLCRFPPRRLRHLHVPRLARSKKRCRERQGPRLFTPGRHPPAGGRELLARRAPVDARHATAILASRPARIPATCSATAYGGEHDCSAGGGAVLVRPGGGISAACGGTPATTVPQHLETDRRSPRHRQSGTAVPSRDRGPCRPFRTPPPGHRAHTHWPGRGRGYRLGASQSLEARRGRRSPAGPPAAISASGADRHGHQGARAPWSRATRGPSGQSSLAHPPQPDSPTGRIGGRRGGHGPHRAPPGRSESRRYTLEHLGPRVP